MKWDQKKWDRKYKNCKLRWVFNTQKNKTTLYKKLTYLINLAELILAMITSKHKMCVRNPALKLKTFWMVYGDVLENFLPTIQTYYIDVKILDNSTYCLFYRILLSQRRICNTSRPFKTKIIFSFANQVSSASITSWLKEKLQPFKPAFRPSQTSSLKKKKKTTF